MFQQLNILLYVEEKVQHGINRQKNNIFIHSETITTHMTYKNLQIIDC